MLEHEFAQLLGGEADLLSSIQLIETVEAKVSLQAVEQFFAGGRLALVEGDEPRTLSEPYKPVPQLYRRTTAEAIVDETGEAVDLNIQGPGLLRNIAAKAILRRPALLQVKASTKIR